MHKKIFRTITPQIRYQYDISYRSKVMFIESCFTENIGKRMTELKFDTLINPFGILYNPISVERALQYIAGEAEFTENDLIFHNELWHSMHHHGEFSRTQPQDSLNFINSNLKHAALFLKQADFLFLTFGSAWVYVYKKTQEIVANCHKIPNTEFDLRMLDPDQILIEYFQLIKLLNTINPKLKIIFTISPVRHLSNGQTGNFFSKSVLAVAIQQLLSMYADEQLFYFPAYEIMMDDLRDYRFFASDMIHPSEDAVNYVFDYFQNTFFSNETTEISSEIEKIVKACSHRPFNTDTESYASFKKTVSEKLKTISERYPNLNFELEKSYFNVV